MFLALKEMRRAAGRFVLLALVATLLMFLLLILQTFRVALVTLFVGAIENQSAPVLVYDVDGRRSLTGSTIDAEMRQRIEAVDAVGAAGRLGQSIVPVSVGGTATVASIIGFDEPALGAPLRVIEGRLPNAPGEGVASDAEFSIGDRIDVEPGGTEVVVVGVSNGSDLFASSVFVKYDTYLAAIASANPDAGTPLPNALAVRPTDGTTDAELVRQINAAGDDIDALTRADAASLNPAVRTVTGLFNSLLPLFGVVVPLVTGVFFLVITVQKAASLTLLRALGAPSAALVRSLLLQVAMVLAVGLALGTMLYWLTTQADVAGVDLPFEAGVVAFWAPVLLALGLVSSVFAVRQVLRIDPIRATTGAGVGR